MKSSLKKLKVYKFKRLNFKNFIKTLKLFKKSYEKLISIQHHEIFRFHYEKLFLYRKNFQLFSDILQIDLLNFMHVEKKIIEIFFNADQVKNVMRKFLFKLGFSMMKILILI